MNSDKENIRAHNLNSNIVIAPAYMPVKSKSQVMSYDINQTFKSNGSTSFIRLSDETLPIVR